MKNRIHIFLTLITLCGCLTLGQSQCDAAFEWEQVAGTLQIHFINHSASENPPFSNLWNFGDGHMGDGLNPTHTYDAPGTYNVCLIIQDQEGCIEDVCHMVTVAATSDDCNAAFEWEQVPGTLQIHFVNQSTSDNPPFSNLWNFGDGHTGDGLNPTHTYGAPGTYNVCLIIEDEEGCVADVCHEVTVAPINTDDCEAGFEWESNGLIVHFINTSDTDPDIISYQWDFGDGTEGDGANPVHTYTMAGSYEVCLTIENEFGCIDEICHLVVVTGSSGDCEANFEWESNGLIIHFINNSDDDPDIVSYYWDFGDGHFSDDANPTHTYGEPGSYEVCLTIENEFGCTDMICHLVVVEAGTNECNAAFEWEQIPGSLQIHFVNQSTSNHDIISYHWNFGDGHEGDGQNPTHTYGEPGTYLVCLIITDGAGCVSDVCHEVTVEAATSECNAEFEWESDGLFFHFFSTSTSNHDIISYVWHFGDGTSSDNNNDPVHTYAEPGVYNVCLIITDAAGCVSDVCHEVVAGDVSGECEASFTWEPGGDNPMNIHFHSTSTSEHDIVSYHWNFGDGHEGDGANPTHLYGEPGTYVVCLIITDASGCVSDVCYEVTVGQAACNAAFTWEGNGLVIHFINQSSPHDNITYQWNFGDGHGSDAENPTYTYGEPGTYLVCLIITTGAGCVSDVCHEVVVGEAEACNADFEWESGGLFVHFFSTSTSNHDIISYVWHFGDGQSGDGNDPTHTYDEGGVYNVCLIITDAAGCVADVCHEVVVEGQSDNCNASFTYEENNEGVVFFNNTSTGATDHTTWFWAFGDGVTSEEESPDHAYPDAGVYEVCLFMNDSTIDCSDEFCILLFYMPGWQDLHWDEGVQELTPGDSPNSKFGETTPIFKFTNPASDKLIMAYSVDKTAQIGIEIYDLTGSKVIFDNAGRQNKGIHNHTLDISHLSPGLYIASIMIDGVRTSAGLIVTRH